MLYQIKAAYFDNLFLELFGINISAEFRFRPKATLKAKAACSFNLMRHANSSDARPCGLLTATI